MTKGYSLEQDLKSIINSPKYSDIIILCEDDKKLYGSRAILAARSEVFDKLLYNGMKESFEKEISFPKINSFAMEIILEYIYTGSVEEKSLTKDNIIEAFYAADYFQLSDLQKIITNVVKDTLLMNYTENYSPELLSKIMETMPSSTEDDNILLESLVRSVAALSLNTLEMGRLNIAALQYLLAYTHEKDNLPFATPEYEVFRYSAFLAAKQFSDDAYLSLEERLPTLENVDDVSNEGKTIVDSEKIFEILEPLTKFIDFKRIKGSVLTDIIEPLEIVSPKILNNAYRYKTKHRNSDLNGFRGVAPSLFMFDESDCVWDEYSHGSHISIMDDRKVIETSSPKHQFALAKIQCERGIYEWDVVIEKYCAYVWIGVCTTEIFDYSEFMEGKSTTWMLASSGDCSNNGKKFSYCPPFIGDYKTVTVHLDMTKKTIAFTVDGKRYQEVSGWNNLPSILHPVVSIVDPGRIRIQPHQNRN
ncbi:hypothetical protein C1645_828271 [Glomus cerebriforme]|uniref:Concanavalin A-like lectin/glucanase domain-containing protein n=1 Tax=Glomus cerebriforme TaxID=658196 RepID=A0A397SWJ4_9GLOM|nr:hypothetical protein C1645_828271 [Glomus cerebriforme]